MMTHQELFCAAYFCYAFISVETYSNDDHELLPSPNATMREYYTATERYGNKVTMQMTLSLSVCGGCYVVF